MDLPSNSPKPAIALERMHTQLSIQVRATNRQVRRHHSLISKGELVEIDQELKSNHYLVFLVQYYEITYSRRFNFPAAYRANRTSMKGLRYTYMTFL